MLPSRNNVCKGTVVEIDFLFFSLFCTQGYCHSNLRRNVHSSYSFVRAGCRRKYYPVKNVQMYLRANDFGSFVDLLTNGRGG